MDILKGLHKEFGWFIWGLVGLGFVWFFTGGPDRAVSHQGQFLKPLAPVDTGEAYGNYYAGVPTNKKQTLDLPEDPSKLLEKAGDAIEDFFELANQAKEIHTTSLVSQTIVLDGTAGAKNKSVNDEYLRIISSQSAKEPILISGLTLRGHVFGTKASLPKAANLVLTGITANKTDVLLPPNGRVIISSGRSPIGTSFRVNMCTGYLDQFQSYTPALFKECPIPTEELALYGPKHDTACVQFVEKLPRCKVYQGSFPSDIGASCKKFVVEKLNYNACAQNHRYDTNFFENEWRLFLEGSKELWGNKNEVIRLIDTKGKIIDAITY